jgi:nucleotide-binding universal stress UspA family protein
LLNLRRALADGVPPVGAERSIACVPPTWAPRVHDGRPVLLAIEDPADCVSTLESGLQIARAHRTSLHVLHVWQLPGRCDEMVERQVGSDMTESLRASLLIELERCRRQEEYREVPVDLDVRHGTPAALVVQLARDAQVVAIGRNQPGPDGSVRLGRVAGSALYESPCPTMLLSSSTNAASIADPPLQPAHAQ